MLDMFITMFITCLLRRQKIAINVAYYLKKVYNRNE